VLVGVAKAEKELYSKRWLISDIYATGPTIVVDIVVVALLLSLIWH